MAATTTHQKVAVLRIDIVIFQPGIQRGLLGIHFGASRLHFGLTLRFAQILISSSLCFSLFFELRTLGVDLIRLGLRQLAVLDELRYLIFPRLFALRFHLRAISVKDRLYICCLQVKFCGDGANETAHWVSCRA